MPTTIPLALAQSVEGTGWRPLPSVPPGEVWEILRLDVGIDAGATTDVKVKVSGDPEDDLGTEGLMLYKATVTVDVDSEAESAVTWTDNPVVLTEGHRLAVDCDTTAGVEFRFSGRRTIL